MAARSIGIPAFEVGTNRSVFGRYQHPAWFGSPRRRGDDCFKIVSGVQDLRSRHQSCLIFRQVGCEVFVKLRGIEISETVSRFPYSIGFAEVAWKSFSIISLIFS